MSLTTEKLDLIATLAEQRKASSKVTAGQGADGIIAAYGNGETIEKLAKLHSRFSEDHGRIYPFYEEDEWGDLSGEVGDEDDALGTVVYHWETVSKVDAEFSNYAYHLSEMENSLSDLISWHPRYDSDSGELA